jgi:hypothetical protein
MDIKMTQKHNKVKQIVSSNNKKKGIILSFRLSYGFVVTVNILQLYYDYQIY